MNIIADFEYIDAGDQRGDHSNKYYRKDLDGMIYQCESGGISVENPEKGKGKDAAGLPQPPETGD